MGVGGSKVCAYKDLNKGGVKKKGQLAHGRSPIATPAYLWVVGMAVCGDKHMYMAV